MGSYDWFLTFWPLQCPRSHVIKLWVLGDQPAFLTGYSIPVTLSYLGQTTTYFLPISALWTPCIPPPSIDLHRRLPPTAALGSRHWMKMQPRNAQGMRSKVAKPLLTKGAHWGLAREEAAGWSWQRQAGGISRGAPFPDASTDSILQTIESAMG